jgi:hypothetical protein
MTIHRIAGKDGLFRLEPYAPTAERRALRLLSKGTPSHGCVGCDLRGTLSCAIAKCDGGVLKRLPDAAERRAETLAQAGELLIFSHTFP